MGKFFLGVVVGLCIAAYATVAEQDRLKAAEAAKEPTPEAE